MHSRHAFTLVELSIVLVILGLLVGGVLAGQSLIHASELRSIPTEKDRYVVAINAFKEKYMAIPGDMSNATSYWGAAHATPATCVNTVGTSPQTCNGNGDGQVAPITDSAQINEGFRFWQQLANAGLVEGQYDGVTHGSTAYSQTAANTPKGKYPGMLWSAEYFGQLSGVTGLFDADYGHILGIGAVVANNTAQAPLLKPEDVYNIDMKTDDGMPGTGKVLVGSSGGLSNCTTTNSATTYSATYLLSSPTVACTIAFARQFR